MRVHSNNGREWETKAQLLSRCARRYRGYDLIGVTLDPVLIR